MTDPSLATRAAALDSLPIEIRICVGRARMSLGKMLAMTPDAVLPLDSRVEDPVQLFVGDKLIAEGALIEDPGAGGGTGQLAVQITRLVEGGHGAG